MERPGLTHNRRAGVVARRSEEHAPKFVAPGFKTPKRGAEETRWRWAAGLVLLLTALLYFVRLGDRALWASEFRWGEVAREMLLTHDFFWPTINGHLYYDKPLGSYWLVGVPVSVYLGFRTRLGPAGLWWGFVVSLAAVAIVLYLRTRRVFSRELRRVGVERAH